MGRRGHSACGTDQLAVLHPGIAHGTETELVSQAHGCHDTLTFQFNFPDKKFAPDKPPEDGGYIRGIYTDGVKWDHDKLMLVDSEFGVLNTELTIIHLMPVQSDKKEIRHVYPSPF